jgi:hypothetical protein
MVNRRFLRAANLCGAAGLVACGAALPAYAANLLLNPGFEAPAEPPGVNSNCAGWTFVLDCQRAPFNQSHPTNPDPTSVFGIWAKTFQPAGGGIFQDVGSISPGANYDMKAFLFFENGFATITDPVAARMQLSWFDAGSNPVGTPTTLDISPASNPPLSAWTQFTLSATAPVGAATARVFYGWDGGGPGMGAQSVMYDNAVLDGPGNPPLFSTWIINGSGDWTIPGNWANGVSPNAVDAEAQFFGAITSAQTIFANTGVTAGILRFNNANTYVLAGAGNLTIDVSTGSGLIDVDAGTQKINLPVTLNDNTNADVAGGATLVIADPLNLNGRTLTKLGSGALQIISTVTGGAAPATISVTGGTAQVDFGIGTPATASTAAVANVTVSVSGSKAAFGANQTLRRLDAVTAGAGDQEIDLAGNRVRVYGTPLAIEELNIYNDIKAARLSASGRDGIYDSTSPGAGWAVGVSDQSLDAHGDLSVLVRLTRQGDANVDGTVSLPDFNRLAASFGQGGLWDNGDFNFDGLVNLQDFNLLAGNFGLSASPGGPTPADWGALLAAVPETGTVGTGLILVSASLLRVRRRRVN